MPLQRVATTHDIADDLQGAHGFVIFGHKVEVCVVGIYNVMVLAAANDAAATFLISAAVSANAFVDNASGVCDGGCSGSAPDETAVALNDGVFGVHLSSPIWWGVAPLLMYYS